MERIKSYSVPHSKNERIGIPTSLLNQNGQEILTGDKIHIRSSDYEGIVMWNRHQDCFGVFFGLWYLDLNPYNPDCYGKFIPIPKDQGMRMELVPV